MDWPPVLTLVGAVLTSLITVIGTIYVARSKTKTDIGSSITTSFKELTDQLQQERTDLTNIITSQRETIEANRKRIDYLMARCRKSEKHIDLLERMLSLLGQEPPPRVDDIQE